MHKLSCNLFVVTIDARTQSNVDFVAIRMSVGAPIGMSSLFENKNVHKLSLIIFLNI